MNGFLPHRSFRKNCHLNSKGGGSSISLGWCTSSQNEAGFHDPFATCWRYLLTPTTSTSMDCRRNSWNSWEKSPSPKWSVPPFLKQHLTKRLSNSSNFSPKSRPGTRNFPPTNRKHLLKAPTKLASKIRWDNRNDWSTRSLTGWHDQYPS